MGTRRSKHNKGVKPLYKEFRGTAAPDTPWWDEIPTEDKDLRDAVPAPARRIAPKVEVELEDRVKRYLAARALTQPVEERVSAAAINGAIFKDRFIDGDEYGAHAEKVRFSDNDILSQMYIERRIATVQLRGGHAWQLNREWATIQPHYSMDWGNRQANRRAYQSSGDLRENQWLAMKRRRAFIEQCGLPTASFLDNCLGDDASRNHLLKLFGVGADVLHRSLSEALWLVCSHFGVHLSNHDSWRTQ